MCVSLSRDQALRQQLKQAESANHKSKEEITKLEEQVRA